jgi:hypothetical protein
MSLDQEPIMPSMHYSWHSLFWLIEVRSWPTQRCWCLVCFLVLCHDASSLSQGTFEVIYSSTGLL